MTSTEFFSRFGFERRDVTLSNWRSAPFCRWAFQHAGEVVPSATIAAGGGAREMIEPVSGSLLDEIEVDLGAGEESARAYLARSHTDAFVMMKDGAIVAEYYAAHSDPDSPHIVFSISKSITAVVLGILQERGVADPEARVVDYVPEVAGSAYGDCMLRHLLDMRVSLSFDESYLNADGDYARYRRATLWNPADAGQTVENLPDFLASIRRGAAPHGGPFSYASPNSDLLGIVIERAAGRRYCDLVSELLWKPLGAKSDAFVTVDAIGTARAAGGVSTTARDLARLGEAVRAGGFVDGRQVIPRAWISDTLRNGDPQAWAGGDFSELFGGGRYRNKWYVTGDPHGSFCGIGIHGQWLHVDPEAGTVAVKLSSQPLPQDDAFDRLNVAFLAAINRDPRLLASGG